MNVVDGRVGQEELAMWDSEQLQPCSLECRFISDLTLISHNPQLQELCAPLQ